MRLKTVLFISALLLTGCEADNPALDPIENPDVNMEYNDDTGIAKGVIRIKLSPGIGDDFTVSYTGAGVRSSTAEMNSYLASLNATGMERVFPYAGKFEERTRREGLHLWYDVRFDETFPVTRAAGEAAQVPGVDVVEEIHIPILFSYKMYSADTEGTRLATSSFDDPDLSLQWHYHNTGAYSKSIAGADINLFEAWQIETGKPEVIVSVVDGGIDVAHEDIVENMWINTGEEGGTDGVDDDGNGYIDDIHGYNFVTKRGLITADDHGTHVAGTVAARNNNGKGVCGVAGGDGTPGSGVRLISCQVFEGNNSASSFPEAIKYGADNGAVISQNSWGHNGSNISSSEKAAVDYFIKYAGCDNNGNQLPNSPMKGGVVIFAAGNDNADARSYPAAYEPIISVSAMAPDFKKAWYTNRGDWISIMAPGGDEFYSRGMVYSTVPGNSYGYLQGTSMACPHVSGIAALVVSHFGGPGFTNDELKERILTSLKPQDIDEYNPSYAGRLGRGYIDARRAFDVNMNIAPEQVADVTTEGDYQFVTLSWKAVADTDDGTASQYKIYYTDKEELNAGNYEKYTPVSVNGRPFEAGETMEHTIKGLSISTKYYFAIVAWDRWDLKSPPTFFSASTKENLPPQLTYTGPETIRIAGEETAELKISVVEPEGQDWDYKVSGQNKGVAHKRDGDNILVTISCVLSPGEYKATFEVYDIFNYISTMDVPFEIYENQPPTLTKSFDKHFVPLNSNNYTVNLSEHFSDPDGHEISYEVASEKTQLANVRIEGGLITILPVSVGITNINVTASDGHGGRTNASIPIQVVNDGLVYLAYPIPVTKDFNIRLSNDVSAADISILTTTGDKVMSHKFNVSSNSSRLVTLDLSKCSAGTYVLRVESGGDKYEKYFVKL